MAEPVSAPRPDAPPEGDAAARLLDWYDRHRRRLPWRAAPGAVADPYKVWLSEIMLQQTTTATVAPYFEAFVARWPRVEDLAATDLDEVLHAWQGLGYYARARNLHRCARLVARGHAGRFPSEEAALRRLPGVGPYTAAAIAAIAFGRRATVVDGNVERVMARLHGVTEPLPEAKPRLRDLAAALTPPDEAAGGRPGDYAQAVMDLGATVCTPRAPKCPLCPWAGICVGLAEGVAESVPRRAPRPERPVRRGTALWLLREDGAVLLRRRPERGLLGGMMEVPSTPWNKSKDGSEDGALPRLPAGGRWRRLPGVVRHTFTHFQLELGVAAARLGPNAAADFLRAQAIDGVWCKLDRLGEHALPTVMKKVVRHALAETG